MYRVKALYDYTSPHEDDLSFDIGQIITVTEEEDADWLVGEYADASGTKKSGLFPNNFVEKYEPEPPPRPNRASRIKPSAAPVIPPTPTELEEEQHDPLDDIAPPPPLREVQEEKIATPVTQKDNQISQAPVVDDSPAALVKAEPEVQRQTKPAPAVSKPPTTAVAAKQPPPVVEKPSSFRDRIAAFNKPAAAPVAPFKSSGPSTGFIKKPFVAPPPSRNAYVPPPQKEAPSQKLYRREEDPEIAEQQARDQEAAEKAGLAGVITAEQDEDTPKPTSLKERIALLQKQQLEQAKRAEVTAKEKPKKPPKKRTESQEPPSMRAQDPAVPEDASHQQQPLERVSSDASASRAGPTGRASLDRPVPEVPAVKELLSDANDADQSAAGETTEDAEGESTSVEDEDDRSRRAPHQIPHRTASHHEKQLEPQMEASSGEEEEEEEDEVDAETRRRMELRERMAKMSGGMGMAGMFGPAGGLPMGGAGATKKKKSAPVPAPAEEDESEEVRSQPVRVPMIPVPGMTTARSPEAEDRQLDVTKEAEPGHAAAAERDPDEVADIEDVEPQRYQRAAPPPIPSEHPTSSTSRAPPPVPGDRGVPTVPSGLESPSAGSESDDEMPRSQAHSTRAPPPSVPTAQIPISRVSGEAARSPPTKRTSTFGSEHMSPVSTSSTSDKRASRPPPPIPVASPPMSPNLSRPPPPPPPTAAPPSRKATSDDVGKGHLGTTKTDEETEYEGDYDTDIAAGADHKDALRSHARESSLDDSTTADEAPAKPRTGPSSIPPPIPSVARAVPPPPQPAPPPRQSTDAPRIAPPVPPISYAPEEDDEDYDPYRYSGPPPVGKSPTQAPLPPIHRAPPPQPPPAPSRLDEADSDDDLYAEPTPRDERPPPLPFQAPPAPERAPAPLPPQAPPQNHPPPPVPTEAPVMATSGRKSLDVNRAASHIRKSMDQPRPSIDQGYVATDVDLGLNSNWWAQSQTPPPAFQNRKDILYEMEESTSSKRGGKSEVSKDVYVLFHDYSQTIITARFDAHNPGDVSLEQRHEAPPPKSRQDQLEDAHSRFGQKLADAVNTKQNSVVGDGTPHGLIIDMFQSLPGVLPPIGTRAYGALVYSNLANATQQQFDEIRPGDVITFRNARFEGKHGAMHQKYKLDLGKEHVGIVAEWDGTKKKVRAFEQGRESKKCKIESFRVGDLRSGEVKVWRVMGRAWVGWDDNQ